MPFIRRDARDDLEKGRKVVIPAGFAKIFVWQGSREDRCSFPDPVSIRLPRGAVASFALATAELVEGRARAGSSRMPATIPMSPMVRS
jgi:hypothetical protein